MKNKTTKVATINDKQLIQMLQNSLNDKITTANKVPESGKGSTTT